MRSLHVLPVSAWVLPGFSDFHPQSKNMHVRLIEGSNLSVGVNFSVMVDCLDVVR